MLVHFGPTETQNEIKPKHTRAQKPPKQQQTHKKVTGSGLILLPIKLVGVLLCISKVSQTGFLHPVSADEISLREGRLVCGGR